MLELLYKQLNVDKNLFQQVICDGICYVSDTLHFLFGLQGKISTLSVSDNFYENSLLLKTTVDLTIHHSSLWKIAIFLQY